LRIETVAVHAGADRDPVTRAVAPPIHLSTNYELGPGSEQIGGYIYARNANPTQDRLESALTALEKGEAALVFGSGVAAGAAILQALPPGSHVVFPDDVYYVYRQMAVEYLPRWGMEASIVDMTDLFTPRGRYRAAMPVNGRRELVRQADGVHLNDAGAAVALRPVLAALRADFGAQRVPAR